MHGRVRKEGEHVVCIIGLDAEMQSDTERQRSS